MKGMQTAGIPKWPRKFDKLFQIDRIPLWYFLEPLINSAYLPKPFKARWEIEEDIKINRLPSSFDDLKNNLSAFALKKGLIINEKIKFLISRFGKKNLKEIGKGDVLFVALTDQVSEKDGRLEFSDFGRIINSLKKGEKASPLVLVCDSISKNSLFRLRRYDSLLYDHITPEITKESKQLSNELNEKWMTLDEELKVKLFISEGKNYWKFFKNNMDFLFSNELLFTLVKYYLIFKKILKRYDVKVVYLTSLTGFYELSALGAVYKLSRRVVYSSHGYTGIPAGKWKFAKTIVFAASGAEEKRNFLKGGIKKENIFITGSPFYDEIARYRLKKAQKAEKKTIGLLTTALVESKFMEKRRYFELIHETLAQIGSIEEIGKVIIKLHPAEKYRSEYESIAKSLNLRNVEITQGTTKAELYSVIINSDLLIGFGSTALLEGLMIGKDVIHLDMFLENPELYTFRRATSCIDKIENLAGLIKKVLSDKGTKNALKKRREYYLRESFFKIDGRAYERISDLIERISEEMKGGIIHG